MNVDKLYQALYSIVQEVRIRRVALTLESFGSALQQYASDPSPEHDSAFKKNYSKLCTILDTCDTNDAMPTQRRIFDEIGASKYIGRGLWGQIERVMADNPMTPVSATLEIDRVIVDAERFYKAARTVIARFDLFGIQRDHLSPGEAEVGVGLPPKLTSSTIEGLEKEVQRLDSLLKTIKEITGETVSSATIKSMGSTDLQLFLESTPVVAAFLATAIERIVALYKNILDIRKIRQDLKRKSIPDEITKQIQEYEKGHVKSETEEIAHSLIEEYYKKGDTGRENELKAALAKELHSLADRIARGLVIEAQAAEPQRPEPAKGPKKGAEASRKAQIKDYDEQKKLADAINRSGRSLSQLRQEDQPLLLTTSRDPEEAEIV